MVIATGFFDGVHIGHRLVIEQLVDAARSRGDESLVVTFWPHPRTVLQQEARNFRLLTSMQEKVSMLKSLGVGRVEVIRFTKEFGALTTEQYLKDYLIGDGYVGVGLGYSFKSMIGPLSATVFWSNYSKSVGAYVSIGYFF